MEHRRGIRKAGFFMLRATSLSLTIACLSALLGCHTGANPAAERFGKTFYLDGAGNWGFGASEVPNGLRRAGYLGDVEVYMWTTSFSPLLDQLNRPAARLRALALADRIRKYHHRYPHNEINIIALSAGTGVAVWAVEDLDDDVGIQNLILLGSSLSHDYDVRKALEHMRGRIYVYYSDRDAILDAVKIVGTIDGKRGVASAGQVGLLPPPGAEDRIVNVGWSRRWLPYGWTGTHTDCTSQRFVQRELSRHVLDDTTTPRPATAGKTSRRTPITATQMGH